MLINKVGLYTSPHLRFVRERIQINGEALSETSFATSFFEIWDRLEQSRLASPFPAHQATKPIYFRYLTIMALHTYLKEQVDAAIIECGMGGEYDSTNVLLSPAVAGITSLGIDHVQMLGSTIDKIAWHKAGIMKQGVRVFTSPQPKEAMEVLFSRVKERGASLEVVNVHPQIAAGQVELGLKGDFQRINASLAVELAAHFLRTQKYLDVNTSLLPAKFRAGLKDVRLGGRCEVRLEPHLKWYIDGAHTIESIQATSQWYSSLRAADTRTCLEDMPRILLFNQQTRDGLSLLKQLQEVVLSNTSDHPPFTHAIFCSNITYTSSGYRPDLVSINVDSNIVQGLQVQKELAKGWRDLVKASYRCQIFVVPTIEEAVKQCREIGLAWRKYRPTAEDIPSVLATGSMHLVGGLLDVLEEVSVTG